MDTIGGKVLNFSSVSIKVRNAFPVPTLLPIPNSPSVSLSLVLDLVLREASLPRSPWLESAGLPQANPVYTYHARKRRLGFVTHIICGPPQRRQNGSNGSPAAVNSESKRVCLLCVFASRPRRLEQRLSSLLHREAENGRNLSPKTPFQPESIKSSSAVCQPVRT
jgi:hypothetical protein